MSESRNGAETVQSGADGFIAKWQGVVASELRVSTSG